MKKSMTIKEFMNQQPKEEKIELVSNPLPLMMLAPIGLPALIKGSILLPFLTIGFGMYLIIDHTLKYKENHDRKGEM